MSNQDPPEFGADLIGKILGALGSEKVLAIKDEIIAFYKEKEDEFVKKTFSGYSSEDKEVEAIIDSHEVKQIIFNMDLSNDPNTKKLAGILTSAAMNNAYKTYLKELEELTKVKNNFELQKIKELESLFDKDLNLVKDKEPSIPPIEDNVWDITSYQKKKSKDGKFD